MFPGLYVISYPHTHWGCPKQIWLINTIQKKRGPHQALLSELAALTELKLMMEEEREAFRAPFCQQWVLWYGNGSEGSLFWNEADFKHKAVLMQEAAFPQQAALQERGWNGLGICQVFGRSSPAAISLPLISWNDSQEPHIKITYRRVRWAWLLEPSNTLPPPPKKALCHLRNIPAELCSHLGGTSLWLLFMGRDCLFVQIITTTKDILPFWDN